MPDFAPTTGRGDTYRVIRPEHLLDYERPMQVLAETSILRKEERQISMKAYAHSAAPVAKRTTTSGAGYLGPGPAQRML